MAKLTLPEKAYAWKGDKITGGGKLVMKDKPGKFHLEKSIYKGVYEHSVITVCGKIIDLNDERTVTETVYNLYAGQICQICLGAMKVED